MSTDAAIKSLKKQGHRITSTRKSIIRIIFESKSPISAVSIAKQLDRNKMSVNKTTVYRELAFLLRKNIISEVNINPGVTFYESAGLSHHHHLTCTDCESIQDISSRELEEEVVRLEEKALKSGFTIKKHTLEFYGTCDGCGE